MPQIEIWSRFPPAIRDHLVDRMRDRKISVDDLNRLRLWIESKPSVPEGRWYKDFGSFKLCGEGKYPKTFLVAGQAAEGSSNAALLSTPSQPRWQSPRRLTSSPAPAAPPHPLPPSHLSS